MRWEIPKLLGVTKGHVFFCPLKSRKTKIRDMVEVFLHSPECILNHDAVFHSAVRGHMH